MKAIAYWKDEPTEKFEVEIFHLGDAQVLRIKTPGFSPTDYARGWIDHQLVLKVEKPDKQIRQSNYRWCGGTSLAFKK